MEMIGHGSSSTAGSGGGSMLLPGSTDIEINIACGVLSRSFVVNVPAFCRNVRAVIDSDSRLASDLSLAVMRLARQLRFRRPQSPVSLSQLSALATLANFGPMTPGALAIRERVRPPSMTRVIASLAELGFVDRVAHPDDGRQVLVSVSEAGAELMEAERQASQEWLTQRLETLGVAERDTLRVAADLILALVDESP
jgi:DNA-binding MarR family transcriptional regulator